MDLGDPRTFSLFLEIYGTLPRAGPGSTADTLQALSLVPNPDFYTYGFFITRPIGDTRSSDFSSLST
jgi:hypothetical protein